MKRMVCFLLAMLICMMVPCTALAAVNSSGNTPASNPRTGDVARMDIWVPVLVISALALIVLLVIYFKKFHKK